MIWEEIYMQRARLYMRQRQLNEIAIEAMTFEYLSKEHALVEFANIQNEYNALAEELQMLNLLEQVYIVLGYA